MKSKWLIIGLKEYLHYLKNIYFDNEKKIYIFKNEKYIFNIYFILKMSEYEDFLQRNHSTDGLFFMAKLDQQRSILSELEHGTDIKVKNNVKSITEALEYYYINELIEREDYDTVYLVLIPKSEVEDINSIYSWNLNKFKNYRKVKIQWNPDTLDFDPPLGYSDVLLKKKRSLFKGVSCIWEVSSEYKNSLPDIKDLRNYWIVNFEPFGYECFVEQKYHPFQITIVLYLQILEAYGYELEDFPTLDKNEMFNLIIKGNKNKKIED